ncbi:MAG: Uncharacterised protein [Prochlorococcus marinus str. MIT 9313]|nr:MAG: Uncharacterised protein [Prochlorococcus marinus str. MIT 9313]
MLAAGEGCNLAAAFHFFQCSLEADTLVKRGDFAVVSKQQINVAINQLEEAVAMPINAEAIGKREGYLAS